MTAPVLIVPRVSIFRSATLSSSTTSSAARIPAFSSTPTARPRTVVDYRLKRRNDLDRCIRSCATRSAARSCAGCVPAIERFFQFSATRMDRYIVACYDSAVGGHFHRHRDNVNVGAQHRRFAVTINLNNDYDGCDLTFPEFGRRTYRAPHGGAIVFSCGALHQVTPVTRGRRYAFLAFLYGEADAALREANNAKLHPSAAQYAVDPIGCFPNPPACRRGAPVDARYGGLSLHAQYRPLVLKRFGDGVPR